MTDHRSTRRDFIRSIAVAGAVWAIPTMGGVSAAEADTQKKLCKGVPSICSQVVAQCSSCGPLHQAWCFDIKGNDDKTFCGADDYCSNLQTCVRKCQPGYKCSWHNGCTPDICSNEGSGVCIKVCLKRSIGGALRMQPLVRAGTAGSVRR